MQKNRNSLCGSQVTLHVFPHALDELQHKYGHNNVGTRKKLSPVWSLRMPQLAASTRLRSRNRKRCPPQLPVRLDPGKVSSERVAALALSHDATSFKREDPGLRTQDQSRPTLTKCDRSVLPLFVARQHCAVEAMLASTKG